MSSNIEILEPTPNVKIVSDGHGRKWLCDAGSVDVGDLRAQGCVLAEEIVYDRNFGG